jgi:hypothetical protein
MLAVLVFDPRDSIVFSEELPREASEIHVDVDMTNLTRSELMTVVPVAGMSREDK